MKRDTSKLVRTFAHITRAVANLKPEHRERVIRAVAALYGVRL